MDDAVSDALYARTRGPEGLTKMLLVSGAAHVVLMMLAALAPASFWLRPLDVRPATRHDRPGPGSAEPERRTDVDRRRSRAARRPGPPEHAAHASTGRQNA